MATDTAAHHDGEPVPEAQGEGDLVYVSITGLKLKKWWHIFRFYKHASAAFKQARSAPGNLQAEVRTIGKWHCTLTVWKDREAMRAFIHAGDHAEAIAAFPGFATGVTYGFETTDIPDWDKAKELLDTHGRAYGAS